MFKGREPIDLQGLDNNQIQVFSHVSRGAVDSANVADGDDVPVVLELAERNVQDLAADKVKVRVEALWGEACELGAGVLGPVVEGGVEVKIVEEEADLGVRARRADDVGATALGVDREGLSNWTNFS